MFLQPVLDRQWFFSDCRGHSQRPTPWKKAFLGLGPSVVPEWADENYHEASSLLEIIRGVKGVQDHISACVLTPILV